MKQGDIILVPMQQSDGELKNRPAVFLKEMPVYRDILVCGISTQLHQVVPNFDEMITAEDHDFQSSGLVRESLVRLGYIAVIPRRRILGSIGSISIERCQRLLNRLSNYLTLDSPLK